MSQKQYKQYTFTEMSRKTVINVADGRELGHVCDMVFNNCGGILGFVVPGKKSFFKSITSSDNIFIAWNRIIKIGSDVILVELVGGQASTLSMQDAPPQQNVGVYAQQPISVAEQQVQQPPQYTCPQNSYNQPPMDAPSAQTVYHTDNKTDY